MLTFKSILTIGILLLTLSFYCQANPVAEHWARVTQPTILHKAQSIGTYTAGCISGAVPIAINGQGYQIMRLSRNRFFGHPDLKAFIEQLGQSIDQQSINALLIGDLGQPRGGPTLSGHRSHQTGLDVDIWFLLSQLGHHPLSTKERETLNAPSMLKPHSDDLDYRQWTPTHEKVLQIAAELPNVERIFVNPSIKRELCMRHGHQNWLRKIRPWWHHDDHFHVRLKCPTENPYCQSQESLPAGNGCDASLTWWFSEEAKHPTAPQPSPKPVELPTLCEQVLKK